ncbi:hypothetical protein [Streptomyces sp. A012304]|uniref:hypothetical protein n=1 Tax=Streptomyces sp. A012304 TaxID=375446 RepID=UPI00285265D6|nr:hypothetical protein [Streptomyces sp. A012304]
MDRGLAVATARLRRVGRGRRTPPAAPAPLTAAGRAALLLGLSALIAPIALIIPVAVIAVFDRSVGVVGVAVRLRLGRVLRIRA